ncbi:MAG: tyrosine-type recombinase/integrase [Akkermansiaceae bacterium]|nr:tyrosine-type recombinase/integrase [Akkermansiaceae bacterium]
MAKKNLPKFSKNDRRYWEARVYRPAYRDGKGSTKEAGTFAVRIQAHGERRGVSLRDTSQREAAKSAMALSKLIEAIGWERGLAEFRGEVPKARNLLTLGEYLAEVSGTGEIAPKTLRIYATKVRRIAADLVKPAPIGKSEKFDYVNGGAKAWQEAVERIQLSQLAPDSVQAWTGNYLSQFRNNPAKLASATKTANSCIRAGKAIFAERIRDRLTHLILPEPVPFIGLRTAKERPTRYRSEIENPEVLLLAGSRELAGATSEKEFQAIWREQGGEDPAPLPTLADQIRADLRASRKREAFKSLVLGLCAGLRRGEIDRLQWSEVDFERSQIVIRATDCFAPKANSVGDIPIDGEIVKLLKEWKSTSVCRFVVDGVEPRSDTDGHHYRAERAHIELIRWLKGKGLTTRNPLHALRKEFGSIVCEKAGVYVASRLLRHANIAITAAVYTDDRGRVTSGLGSALSRAGV